MTERRTVLVTGASGGIGEELAKLLAADGFDLVLVARSREGLQRVADELARRHGVACHVLPTDLTDPAAPERIFAETEAKGLRIEVLINNAGFGLAGPFAARDGEASTSLARELEMIQVNISALTHLSKLYLPGMISRKRGRVMNVASTAAFQPGPLMAVYYASKSYVLSFSVGIAVELEGSGVTVTALCPGATRTAFDRTAAMDRSRLFSSSHVMSAEEVAKQGYAALNAGKPVVVTGFRNRLLALATRIATVRTAARIAKGGQEAA
jgi:uncharacterized protein